MFSFLPHLALMLYYYKNNCSLQKEWSLDTSSKTFEVTGNELKRKAERPCTLAAIEYFPTDRADFLLVAWRHGAAVSSDKKKNSLPGRVPSTWLAVFRSEVRKDDNKTWVKQGATESHEQKQRLGTSSLASIPGMWNGRVHHHQHQEISSSNKCHSSQALEVWDVCWQAKRQRGVF